MALRRSDGARVSQLPSGCMPMISECACWAICRTRVCRYFSGIQSRGSTRWSAAMVRSKYASRSGSAGCGSATAVMGSTLPERSVGYRVCGVPEQTATFPRRGRPGYDLASLLRVSVEVFNERGYDGTSMEDLAARLGITKSSIYHHVPGKSELLRLAVDRALDALFAVTLEPAATSGRAIDRLEHVVRRSVDVLAAELPFVTLLLRVR